MPNVLNPLSGGTIEESRVLSGVMFNKDVTHSKMRRRIENPKILLLDCNLEYKKGESQTNIEIMKEEDFSKILEMEETYIKKICNEIIKFSPDLVLSLPLWSPKQLTRLQSKCLLCLTCLTKPSHFIHF